MKKQGRDERVELLAYDSAQNEVLRQRLTFRHYMELSIPVLDDAGFRRARGIVRLVGRIENDAGVLSQEFEVLYDRQGIFVSDACRFGDGTVIGQWPK